VGVGGLGVGWWGLWSPPPPPTPHPPTPNPQSPNPQLKIFP